MKSQFSVAVGDILPERGRVFRAQGLAPNAIPSDAAVSLYRRAREMIADLASPHGLRVVMEKGTFIDLFPELFVEPRVAPVSRVVEQSSRLAGLVFTLGEQVSETIAGLFQSRDFALAAMVDAVASESMEVASRQIEAEFSRLSDRSTSGDEGCRSLLYSPGYCGWPVTAQRNLFDFMNPDTIGIRLTASCLMIPLKSISGVLVAGSTAIHEHGRDYPCCRSCRERTCLDRITRLESNDKEMGHGHVTENLAASNRGR